MTEQHAETSDSQQDSAPPLPTMYERQREELTMLMMGFGTGISIALIFLVYLVFEYAKFLP